MNIKLPREFARHFLAIFSFSYELGFGIILLLILCQKQVCTGTEHYQL